MEKRQIQRTGGASYTVTLPKWWITRYGLTHKSPIEIHTQTSGSLLIKANTPTTPQPPARLAIEHHTNDMITREAVALFIAGINEIEFYSPAITQKQRIHIRHVSHRLIGFEIIDESSKTILIKNIFDLTKLPVPEMVEKMIFGSHTMLEDAIEAVITNNHPAAQDVIGRDLEIDKLYLIINRQFHSVLDDTISEEEVNLERAELNYYRTIAIQLERIADHAIKIAEMTLGRQENSIAIIAKSYQPIVKKLLNNLTIIRSMVQSTDSALAHQLLNTSPLMEKEIIKQRQKHPETSHNIIISDSLDRIRSYIMNTAETTIDNALRHRTRLKKSDLS